MGISHHPSPVRPLSRPLLWALLPAALALQACHKQPSTTPQANPSGGASAEASGAVLSPKPIASIKELMDATVDPAADGVWDSVGVYVTKAGTDKREPRNAEEWQQVRRHALTLVEAMNLVMMEGRHAAPPGTKAGLGELPPQQIDAAITANRAQFDTFAGAARDVGLEVLQAVDRKDVKALMRLGGTLDERCEACHVTFWYPNSPQPGK